MRRNVKRLFKKIIIVGVLIVSVGCLVACTNKKSLYSPSDWATADEFLELWMQFKESHNLEFNALALMREKCNFFRVWQMGKCEFGSQENVEVHTLDPVEMVYSCGIFSFVQTAEMAPTYQLTSEMYLTEMREDNESVELGYMKEIGIAKTDVFDYFIESGSMYLLFEQKNGALYLGVGSRNLQNGDNQPADPGKLCWIYKVKEV